MNPPWASSDHVDVMSRGIGGFLYATRAATPSGASLEILRSADGETWESLGQPDFAPATGFEGGATIHVHDGMLRAEVTSGGRSTDVWESVDGESWAYLGQAPTAGNLAQHPDLGWVMLGGDENVYVSQDFETWSVLVASPDIDQILGEEGGGAGAKSAGDALFFSAENAASGQRVLWIARLDK